MRAASITARAVTQFLTVALLTLSALTLFAPSYQTNDDIAMRLLAEGNFVPGDEPLPYLMFINVILGKIISLGYELTTSIPWYDLTLGVSMLAASAGLIHIWSGSGRTFELIWSLLFAGFFLFPTLVSVQFSLVGLACAAAGIGLIGRGAEMEQQMKSRRLHLLLGTLLFVWGSLIRFDGAVLMGIESTVLAVPFIVGNVRNANGRQRLRGVFVGACVTLLLTGVGFAINILAYKRAPGWKDFYEYNLLRSRLGEYITPERLATEASYKLAKDVGWSANDFALFRNWFFTDPEVFSLARVRRAERLFYGASNKPAEEWKQVLVRRGRDLATVFFNETRWAFLLMGVFVLAHGLRPKLVLYFVGIALTLGLLIVGISLALKAPPQRIFWPMMIMGATMLTTAARRWGRPMHWSINCAAILAASCIVVATLASLKKESEVRRHAAAVAQSEVDGLRRTGATMFVLHANSFPYEDFWTPLHTEKTPFDFVGLGASARTPPVQAFLARTGRNDLPWSLCNDPAMVIVAAPDVPPMLATFVQEHRGVKVQFEQAFKGKRILAWKCHRM